MSLHNTCTQYFFCVHGKYTTYTCPSGLHWNRNSNVCDFPDNAGCTEGAAGEQEEPDIAEFEEGDAVEEVPDPTPASTTKKTTASWEADYEYKPWQPPTPAPRPDYDGR